MHNIQNNKNHKNRLKTLCTIDTSDIDLQDAKPKTFTYIPSSKNKQKQKVHYSPNTKKKLNLKPNTPSKSSTKYFAKNNSKPKGIEKSPKDETKVKNNNQHATKNNCNNFNNTLIRNKLNKSVSKEKTKCRSRIKTEYSTNSDIPIKSMFSKSHHNFKSRLLQPLQQTYNFQTYQILQQIGSQKKEKVYLVKKMQRLYLMKKTKDAALKKQYQHQAQVMSKLTTIKWKNLIKLVKMYTQKNWLYAIYEHSGFCLSWTNPSHQQVIDKILRNQGAMLKHIIKQVSKAINQLSSRGFAHNQIRLQNICMKIYDLKTTIKVQGNVKLANLHRSFHIKDKNMLLQLPNSIYTPPEIINLKLFQSGLKFDRQLIQYISYYDQPWYIDVWALGVLMLQLIAGEAISIQKTPKSPQYQISLSIQSGSQQQSSSRKGVQINNQITLLDILEAQKSLLIQTQAQIQKIGFDKNLQSLLLRMLSINPLNRPNPKQIIKDL